MAAQGNMAAGEKTADPAVGHEPAERSIHEGSRERLAELAPERTILAPFEGRSRQPSAERSSPRPAERSFGEVERKDTGQRTRPVEEGHEADLYPAFVKLIGRSCLVVGGGPIGLQKTVELLRCGGNVRAVATRWSADFAALDGNPRLTRETRAFEPRDLEEVFLVVAATNDVTTQQAVWREAQDLGILCNVVDVPEMCNFYVPASLRRGSLTVAVSTGGKSPLFAAALRDRLASSLGPQLAPGLERLAEARRLVRALYPEDQSRRRFALGRLLTPEAVDHLLEGSLEAFEAHFGSWKSSLSA